MTKISAWALVFFAAACATSCRQCQSADCASPITVTSGTGRREVPVVAHHRNNFTSADRLLPQAKEQLLLEFNDRAFWIGLDYCRDHTPPCMTQFTPATEADITEIRGPFGSPWEDIGQPGGTAGGGGNRRNGAVVRPTRENVHCSNEIMVLPPPRRPVRSTVNNPQPETPPVENPCQGPDVGPWGPDHRVHASAPVDIASPTFTALATTYQTVTFPAESDAAFQAWLDAAQASCDAKNGAGRCVAYLEPEPEFRAQSVAGNTVATRGAATFQTVLSNQVHARCRPR